MSDHTDHKTGADIGVVIIGRNEGERLAACLRSARGQGRAVVYVDSGSTDGSVDRARSLGAEIVELDMRTPFTAARARNAGVARLRDHGAPIYIQFVDGDCELVDGWIDRAAAFLNEHADVAVVCGRRREKYPERSLYNALVDREWDTPVGEAQACGGDAMVRYDALCAAGHYRADLIAGEEPELCVRLRSLGWKIWRLDAEMTAHDIAMTNLGQWLKRARRAGHAFAEVSHLHRHRPERIWRRETWRAYFWTALALTGLIGGFFAHPLFFILWAAFPLQVTRMALREKPVTKQSWALAALTMMQKPWEAAGALQFWRSRTVGGRRTLIEYKS